MKRFFPLFLCALLMPIALPAQTAKTRTELYAEIAANLASGQSITAAQLRATFNNVVASTDVTLTDGVKENADSDLTAAAAITGAGLVDRVSSTDWRTRSWAYIWTALMTDPAAGTFSYTGIPFTINTDKRLLGRDSVLPPFSATEISLGQNLQLSGGVLSVPAIDATPVGAMTPSTGAFASLSLGSSLPSAYLAFNVQNTAPTGYAQINLISSASGVSSTGGINYAAGAFLKFLTSNADPILFEVGGVERGRFTSTGLNGTAIGSSTPAAGTFTDANISSASSIYGIWNTTNSTGGYLIFRTNGTSIGDIGNQPAIQGGGPNANFMITARAGDLILGQNDTERARIDSDGLLIGTTSRIGGAAERLHVQGSTTASTDYGIIVGGNAATNATQALRFYSTSNTAVVGSVTFTTTTTSFNTSSDRRLKTNIRDFKASGAIIDAIKPRIYDWKTGEKDTVGFVAQELHAVYPAAVTKGDDGEEITQQWAVDYSKLVPVLVAEIQALRARVAALEARPNVSTCISSTPVTTAEIVPLRK